MKFLYNFMLKELNYVDVEKKIATINTKDK